MLCHSAVLQVVNSVDNLRAFTSRRVGLDNISMFSLGAMGPASSFWSGFLTPIVEQKYYLPVLSYSGDPNLASPQLFPYFVRLMPSTHVQGDFLGRLIQQFQWMPLCIIQESSSYGTSLAVRIQSYVPAANTTVFTLLSTETKLILGRKDRDIDAAVQSLARAQCKVVVVTTGIEAARQIVNSAVQRDLLRGYHWILGPSFA